MAVSHVQSGTETLTGGGVEDALGTAITAAGTYQLAVDLKDMVIGHEIIIRVKTKILTGGVIAVFWEEAFAHTQTDDPIKMSPPIPSVFSIQMFAKLVTVATPAVQWAIFKY